MRSFNCVFPAVRAQWTQQKICPLASTPWPTTRHWQCGQTGASAWIAHSKLSKVWCLPATITSNALSYSFSQTSHVAIHKLFARRRSFGGVGFCFCEQEVCDAGRIPGCASSALVYRGSCQLPLQLYSFSEVEIARESDSFYWSRS
jgi:hypothetical protein